jgi:hypothetical protein
MATSQTAEPRNSYLDTYNYNHEFEVKFHRSRASVFIPEQYELLIKAGFKPIDAGNRLRSDLNEIWCEKTIREYLPKSARHQEKVRHSTSQPFYEQLVPGEGEAIIPFNKDTMSIETDAEFEAKMAESEKHVSEKVPPVTRRCPGCDCIIEIGKNYSLSLFGTIKN